MNKNKGDGSCPAHHIIGCIMFICFITGDVNLTHLVKEVSMGFLHCEVTTFLSVINKYLGKYTSYCFKH